MKKIKIGIVGCGAIGTSLAKAVVRDFSKGAQLTGLFDINLKKARDLSRNLSKNVAVGNLSQLIKKSDLVIEAASAKISAEIALTSLSAGRDVMIMSVGGLVGKASKIRVAAIKSGHKVYIPSGAISGVDAVKAARIGRIKKATLTTTKNPLAFKGVKYVEDRFGNLSKIKKPMVLFSGPAQEAVKYFPQNINVAAVLSIAGIGAEKTIVKIIASPGVKKNIHEISIIADAGNINTRTENILHPDNPKTSFLAVLSAQAALSQILEPVKIGT